MLPIFGLQHRRGSVGYLDRNKVFLSIGFSVFVKIITHTNRYRPVLFLLLLGPIPTNRGKLCI